MDALGKRSASGLMAFFPCVKFQLGVEIVEQTTNMDAMKDTVDPMYSLERLRPYAAAALMPFVIEGARGCETTARLTAESLLQGYQPATPKELQLAAQIIASGWATLALLSAASVAKHKSVDEMLRLQRDALKLHRAEEKATKALEARRKQRAKTPQAMTAAHRSWEEGVFQLVLNQALDKHTDATARVAAYVASLKPVVQKPKPDVSITK